MSATRVERAIGARQAAACFALLATLIAAPAFAQKGDAARGEKLAAPCAACHGTAGTSVLPGTPSLAAQPETYLVTQMILFREGLRQVPAMNAALAQVKEQDIMDLAAYYARQTLAPTPGERNATLYASGAQMSQGAGCGGCHLPDYRGREQMPRLAGQREDYLFATMRAYRDNQRNGSDTTMIGILYAVPDDALKALAHYFAQQK